MVLPNTSLTFDNWSSSINLKLLTTGPPQYILNFLKLVLPNTSLTFHNWSSSINLKLLTTCTIASHQLIPRATVLLGWHVHNTHRHRLPAQLYCYSPYTVYTVPSPMEAKEPRRQNSGCFNHRHCSTQLKPNTLGRTSYEKLKFYWGGPVVKI